jgi:CBS domain-containing protein
MHALVKDIMTTNVVTVRADTSYKEMAAMPRAHGVSGFPVVDDDGIVVGVVSETDLLAKQALNAASRAHHRHLTRLSHRRERAKADGITAGDLMTRPAVTVGPDEPAWRASRLMSSRKVRRLPVVDPAGHLAGIISRADVLGVFTRPDEEIRQEVTEDVILDGFFTDPASLTVTVKNGIVTLEGSMDSVVLGRGIAGQAWHVEGVVAVRDRFTYRPSDTVPVPGPPF